MDQERLRTVISAARAGRQEAYQELLAAFGPRLYGYFFRATASHHDAEDLLGEVMLRLVKQLAKYDDRGRFEPWIFSIAANLVRDRIRRWRTHPQPASLEAPTGEGQSLTDNLAGADDPVDAGLLGADLSVELTEALGKLDDASRQMVLLRHFAEMSFKEIAAVFQCPLGTVLAKVHRAMKVLKATLEDEHDA
jgi:RNA polymerase sigma-70 factor (ECF subfamily)